MAKSILKKPAPLKGKDLFIRLLLEGIAESVIGDSLSSENAQELVISLIEGAEEIACRSLDFAYFQKFSDEICERLEAEEKGGFYNQATEAKRTNEARAKLRKALSPAEVTLLEKAGVLRDL